MLPLLALHQDRGSLWRATTLKVGSVGSVSIFTVCLNSFSEPDEMLNPKKKIFEQIQVCVAE